MAYQTSDKDNEVSTRPFALICILTMTKVQSNNLVSSLTKDIGR